MINTPSESEIKICIFLPSDNIPTNSGSNILSRFFMSRNSTNTNQKALRVLLIYILLALPFLGTAQQIVTADTIPLVPKILKGSEISEYDQKTRQLVAEVRKLMENRTELESLRKTLKQDDSLIMVELNLLRDTLFVFSLDQLDKFETDVVVYNNKIEPWIKTISDWREDTDQFKKDMEFDLEVWNLTSDSIQSETRKLKDADSTTIRTLNRIEEQLQYNITRLSTLEEDFGNWERDLLDTENSLTLARSELSDVSELINQKKGDYIYNIWVPEYDPIWVKVSDSSKVNYLEGLKLRYQQAIHRSKRFSKDNSGFYSRLVFSFILLLSLIFFMRKRVGDLFREHPEIAVEDNVVLSYPVISALVIFVYSFFILYEVPAQIRYLVFLFSIIPFGFLLWRLKSLIKVRYIVFFVIFSLIFIYISVFSEASRQMRFTMIFINLLCIYFLLDLRKDKELIAGENKYWLGTLPGLIPIFMFFNVMSILANVIGSVQLSLVLTRTVLGTFLAYIVIKESVKLIQSFLYLLIVGPLFRISNIIKEDSQKILNWLEKLARIASYAYWIYLVLGFLKIQDSLFTGVMDFITTPLEVGEVSISLADVLIFYIIIQISIWISRFIRYFLDKEVYPRTHLDKGVASTVSVMIRYTFAFLGFILALAAAGVNLNQVIVGLSALGIGIGFGLQNIVNNFVSGIILALERPISIGDVVRVDDVEGVVRDIGLRASQIRTWDGADVLVPNGSLISGKLLNWTLSDRARRLNFDIRLPLDADIEKAIPIILKATNSVKEIVKNPAPAANYEGHVDGRSVIRVYGWISDINYFFSGGTAFRVAVFEALRKEGFEISLPVINVHMDENPLSSPSPPKS